MRWRIALIPLLTTATLLGISPCEQDYFRVATQLRPGRELPPRTVGIEVEAVVPRSLRSADVQAKVADLLRDLPGVSDVRVSAVLPGQGMARVNQRFLHWLGFDPHDYVVEYRFEGRDYRFSFGVDPSIRAPRGKRGVEIRSPILHTETDREIFLKMMGKMKELGLEENPLSAGTHVHVGAGDLTQAELNSVVANFAKFEGSLLDFFMTYGKRRHHTLPITEQLREGSILGVPIAELIQRSADRRRTLNLFSLNKFGTIEFRLFNSTVNLDTLTTIADFGAKFVQASATRGAEIEALIGNRTAAEALPDLLKFLDVKMNVSAQEMTKTLLAEIDKAQKQSYPLLSEPQRMRLRAVAAPTAIAILAIIAEEVLLPDAPPPPKKKPTPTPTPK